MSTKIKSGPIYAARDLCERGIRFPAGTLLGERRDGDFVPAEGVKLTPGQLSACLTFKRATFEKPSAADIKQQREADEAAKKAANTPAKPKTPADK